MKELNVALLAFTDENGHIMLNRRNDSEEELWGIVGGGIEDDEHPTVAIKREIVEELGYELDEARDNLVFVKEIKLENDSLNATIHFFQATFPGFEHLTDTEEVARTDLQFFPVTEALKLSLMPITRIILED